MVGKAIDLFRRFRGDEPKYIDTVKFKIPDVALLIGQMDGIMYTTVRDGKAERYIHKFKRKSRPLLAVGHDGNQLIILGGEYEFTELGIEDK